MRNVMGKMKWVSRGDGQEREGEVNWGKEMKREGGRR